MLEYSFLAGMRPVSRAPAREADNFQSLRKYCRQILGTLVCTLLISACAQAETKEEKHLNACLRVAHAYARYSPKNYDDIFAVYVAMVDVGAEENFAPDQVDAQKQTIRQKYAALNEREKKIESFKIYSEALTCADDLSHQRNVPEASIHELVDFAQHIAAQYIPAEKKVFLSETHGRTVCHYIADLTIPNGAKPQTQCLYSATRTNEGGLRATQATSKGILAGSIYTEIAPFEAKRVFLLKGNQFEDNTVDGDVIESGVFEYKGVLTYESLTGERSVYSFQRLSSDPLKDIRFYRGN